MRLLLIHADYLEFEAREETQIAEEVPEEQKSGRAEESLAAFMAIEEVDEEYPKQVIENAFEEIDDIRGRVGAESVVVYPYAHLSESLSSPETAIRVMDGITQKFRNRGVEVLRAPFGWYKSFDLSCKGHPMSELSREIKPEKKKPAKERGEEEEFFRFILIDENGEEHEISRGNWRDNEILNREGRKFENLRKFVNYEIGEGEDKGEPEHIDLMKRHELVDYCEVSDVGNFKWHPKGNLIKELVLDYQDRLSREYGAFKIQNPLLYRLNDERIEKLIGEFQEKIYSWDEGGKGLALRPASDPGQFPYAQNLTFTYKQLPLKQYEEASCFRKEQKGELTGLRRVRNFLMTDMHTFTGSEEEAKEEFEELSRLCRDVMDSIISKGDWVMGWEGTEEYWEENKEWIKEITVEMGVPGFVKLMKERSHYYSMKNEFQAIHPSDLATQVSTVQMDKVNGERFNITYVGEDNEEHPCTILHCSTFGSIERTLTFLLEDATRGSEKPQLPLWLSPTQARLVPVGNEHLDDCREITEELSSRRVRADIDDRDETVGKRIRKSEKEWVPYTIVYGDREAGSEEVPVRIRGEGEKDMTIEDLIGIIGSKTEGMPYRPFPLPRLLSRRPTFVG